MAEEVKQHTVVVCHEVKVKDGIVYDQHTCQVIGFTNFGDINSHLLAFEQSLHTDELQPSVAKYMLVFMVRGVIIPLEFPYAQYPTTGITADLLFPVAWEVMRHLECAGLQVHALTCDKASPNRKFFQMHKFESVNGITCRVDNPYSANKCYIYFFADVPHLIKTVRNAWSNSFAGSKTRLLWVSTCILCINIYIAVFHLVNHIYLGGGGGSGECGLPAVLHTRGSGSMHEGLQGGHVLNSFQQLCFPPQKHTKKERLCTALD